jgi:DNA-binding beta-propeller fold protein YncE
LGDLGQVIQVDPQNQTIGRRVDVGSPPVALWFDGERVWAAAPDGGKVFAIDPARGEVVETIEIDGYPVALASTTCGDACRDVWTANQSGDSVSRISLE